MEAGDRLMATRIGRWSLALVLLSGVVAMGWGLESGIPGTVVDLVKALLAGEEVSFSPGQEKGGTGLLLLGIAAGTLISEDLASIASGLLAAAGHIGLGSAILASFAGILVGDWLIFAAGSLWGRPVLHHRWARQVVSEAALARAEALFRRYGIGMILITRFIPGTRAATYFAAGMLHGDLWRFVLVFVVAAALWTPLLVGASFWAGEQLVSAYAVYEEWALPLLLAAGLLVYAIVRIGIPLLNREGRRRWRGKLLRVVRWEFWPLWVVQFPVVVYVMVYGLIRYRNPLIFTAANPAMPHSGVLGESKSEILNLLGADAQAVPRWRLLPAGPVPSRMAALP